MADPGTIIAVVTISYKVAIKAWSAFQDALNYDDESADVVVRLEIERFRFQTWALNAGLTKNTFDTNLHPIYELVAERLNRITKLFEEAEKVKDSFGLAVSDAVKTRPDKVHSVLSGMASSIRAVGIKLDVDEKAKEQDRKNVSSRIRWALVSKKKFFTLVSTLELHINKLDDLLTETQRRSEKDDWKKINIVVVGNVAADQLDLLQRALGTDPPEQRQRTISGIEALVEKKAINTSTHSKSAPIGAHSLARRELEEFDFQDLQTQNRVLAMPKPATQDVLGPGPFLLERKQYDQDISIQNKQVLKARLHRLILLLSSTKSDDFRTFRAVGYCEDPTSFSWWLIFQCPFQTNVGEMECPQPISLKDLFPLKYKPPLEDRMKLASLLSKTLAELFNSGWMHKGIRSENILFPETYNQNSLNLKHQSTNIISPFLGGFEYSRQDTEAFTIDKGKHLQNIQSAIYRHPDYQGEAASGYKMKYDIYSFGMVLVEIALWTPLTTILNAKGVKSNSFQLSSTMTRFHTEEALELKNRVLSRVKTELAFRVGSQFRDVVQWCLTMSENEDEEEWHPALGFHNNVVSPLERCIPAHNS